MNYSKILTKEFLYKEYIINHKSITQIAKQIGCDYSTIKKHLKKYDILLRSSKYSDILTKDFLYQEYIINKKPTTQISKETNINIRTIWNYLIKYGIKTRSIGESRIKWNHILTKEFLIKTYVINKKSTLQIAKEVGCSHQTIINYLKIYKIKRRNQSEAMKGKFIGNDACNYKDGYYSKTKKYICIDCGKEISTGSVFGRCKSCARKEEYKDPTNHPNWLGGKSFEPYPLNWTATFREQIRQRDNHKCQICGKTQKQNKQKLSVHHIDYDKNNLNPENLISLCHKCHRESNYNREIYMEYFGILTESIK